MATVGQVLEHPATGERFVFRATAAATDGRCAAFEASGGPSRFGLQEHVHPHQSEGYTVLSGAIGLVVGGSARVLAEGESGLVPPGVPHRLFAVGTESPVVRFELRPAGRVEEFLERYVELGHKGQFTRRGLPRLLPGAAMAREFEAVGHATRPPLAVQRALLGPLAALHRWIEATPAEYAFVDQWHVDAPIHAVFDALADARSYPEWWRPVYLDVSTDGPPAVGRTSRQRFKGRLPYSLRTSSRIVRLEPPTEIVADVTGDLSGRGTWTLAERSGGTHVRFDWRVRADRTFIRALTPLLRPVFRRNHAWAIARAVEGLEPYARRAAARAQPRGDLARAGV